MVCGLHVQHHHSWAMADAWDALFPSDAIPLAGTIPERDPFLTPPFVYTALAIRLIDRYTPYLATPYHRWKALVMQLYPAWMHAALPRGKQIFSQTFALYQHHHLRVERSLAYGLLDPQQLAACHNPSLLRSIQAIERWIVGAESCEASAITE